MTQTIIAPKMWLFTHENTDGIDELWEEFEPEEFYDVLRENIGCKWIEKQSFPSKEENVFYTIYMNESPDDPNYNYVASTVLTKFPIWGRQSLTGNFVVAKEKFDSEGNQTLLDMDLTLIEFVKIGLAHYNKN